MSKPRIFAFYLPQYHPIPENDEWWGKGFTEWRSVGSAKSLFPGHKQPKIPTELGYYDLRIPEVRQTQAELAMNAGIEGFCYWHYWFGKDLPLLEKPLQEVIQSGKPDFPFCLAWANESWEAKVWSRDGRGNKTLIEQKYGGLDDITSHFYHILPALKDIRYSKIDGKNIFMIYKPDNLTISSDFFSIWQSLASKNNLPPFYFIAHANPAEKNMARYLDMGYDGVYTNRIMNATKGIQRNFIAILKNTVLQVLRLPRLVNFNSVTRQSISDEDRQEVFFPGILCGWDHTPRSKRKGVVVYNFNEKTFRRHLKSVFSLLEKKSHQHKIVFLKSWNEWGEGNFMEPDKEFGNLKITTLHSEISK